MKATATLKAADRNPYSWNMEFYEYPDGSGYEGRFTKCGICVLMKKLGLYDLTPALCRSLPKITGEIGFLHRPASVPAFTKPFFLYLQSQYGPPEARVYCRTKSVTPPASLMV